MGYYYWVNVINLTRKWPICRLGWGTKPNIRMTICWVPQAQPNLLWVALSSLMHTSPFFFFTINDLVQFSCFVGFWFLYVFRRSVRTTFYPCRLMLIEHHIQHSPSGFVQPVLRSLPSTKTIPFTNQVGFGASPTVNGYITVLLDYLLNL
jgi:hypothetical protein